MLQNIDMLGNSPVSDARTPQIGVPGTKEVS